MRVHNIKKFIIVPKHVLSRKLGVSLGRSIRKYYLEVTLHLCLRVAGLEPEHRAAFIKIIPYIMRFGE